MKRPAIIGALGSALLAVTSTAQAHVNVDMGIGVPGVIYAEPALRLYMSWAIAGTHGTTQSSG